MKEEILKTFNFTPESIKWLSQALDRFEQSVKEASYEEGYEACRKNYELEKDILMKQSLCKHESYSPKNDNGKYECRDCGKEML